MSKITSVLAHGLAAACIMVALQSAAQAQTILCQRNKAKIPSVSGPVLNLKVVNGRSCPRGFAKLGEVVTPKEVQGLVDQRITSLTSGGVIAGGAQGIQGAQGLPGAQGLRGVQGVKGESGASGPVGATGTIGPAGLMGAVGADGIVAINSCYTRTLNQSGGLALELKLFCNNPTNEFVQNVGYAISDDTASLVRQTLEYTSGKPVQSAALFGHPIGASLRSFRAGLESAKYTLSGTILCCPIAAPLVSLVVQAEAALE